MPFPLIPLLIGAGVKGVTSLLGQRNANKQEQARTAEQNRLELEKYNRDKVNYENAQSRKKATINFAKAVSKAHGYNIPDSAFDAVLNQTDEAFPAFVPSAGGYKPNTLVSGLVGAGTGGLEAYGLNKTPAGKAASRGGVPSRITPTDPTLTGILSPEEQFLEDLKRKNPDAALTDPTYGGQIG